MDISEIYLRRFHATAPPPDAALEMGALTMLFQTFAQALATNYFERHKLQMQQAHSGTSQWPAVWNFARVVRNAMAHGGKISILNKDAKPVTWKGLTYSYADNGRDILRNDLWPGDFFDLIQEMDAAFQSTLKDASISHPKTGT
jgi:Cu/Ag efflux protein CusF